MGNLFFPLLEEIPNLFIHACDFSKRAVQFVKVSCFFFVLVDTVGIKILFSCTISSIAYASPVFWSSQRSAPFSGLVLSRMLSN